MAYNGAPDDTNPCRRASMHARVRVRNKPPCVLPMTREIRTRDDAIRRARSGDTQPVDARAVSMSELLGRMRISPSAHVDEPYDVYPTQRTETTQTNHGRSIDRTGHSRDHPVRSVTGPPTRRSVSTQSDTRRSSSTQTQPLFAVQRPPTPAVSPIRDTSASRGRATDGLPATDTARYEARENIRHHADSTTDGTIEWASRRACADPRVTDLESPPYSPRNVLCIPYSDGSYTRGYTHRVPSAVDHEPREAGVAQGLRVDAPRYNDSDASDSESGSPPPSLPLITRAVIPPMHTPDYIAVARGETKTTRTAQMELDAPCACNGSHCTLLDTKTFCMSCVSRLMGTVVNLHKDTSRVRLAYRISCQCSDCHEDGNTYTRPLSSTNDAYMCTPFIDDSSMVVVVAGTGMSKSRAVPLEHVTAKAVCMSVYG